MTTAGQDSGESLETLQTDQIDETDEIDQIDQIDETDETDQARSAEHRAKSKESGTMGQEERAKGEMSKRPHTKEFVQCLNIARRSLFADASLRLVFEKQGLVASDTVTELLADGDLLSRKLTNFSRTL